MNFEGFPQNVSYHAFNEEQAFVTERGFQVRFSSNCEDWETESNLKRDAI